MALKLVVGLGNPGKSYASTRHNVGYRVIELLEPNPPDRVWLFKPESVYMNQSGAPVSELMRKKGVQPQELLVVCDDFMLPLGSLRFRLKGSSGGHNGLDSILQSLGLQEVPRLRVGIGPVPEGQDPADFVLQSFRPAEKSMLETMLEQAAEAVRVAAGEGIETAMNRFNKTAA